MVKKTPPFVSVILLNYNGEEILEECLDSILLQDYSHFEVIVIDNASEDNSISIIKKYAERIRFECNNRNLGYAAGMNFGASLASDKADYLAFITHDVILNEEWIRQMVQLARESKGVAFSSKIYDESKNAAISKLKIIYPSGHYYIPLNEENPVIEVDFPSGEAFLIHRSRFERIGKFDEEYFAYYEDGDLGWRARMLGHKVLLNPYAHVEHRRSYSFKRINLRTRIYLHERNRIVTCLKHFSPTSLLAFILSETLMLTFHCLRNITGQDHDEAAKAYINAISYVTRTLKQILKKRKHLQKQREISDRRIFEESLPRDAIKKQGLMISYKPGYKAMERRYLMLLDLITNILPPR